MKTLKLMLCVLCLISNITINGNDCFAQHGEDPEECTDRILYQNTWLIKTGSSYPGATMDMKKLIPNYNLKSCDVESEHVMFEFELNDFTYFGEILKGHMLIVFDDKNNICGSFVRL